MQMFLEKLNFTAGHRTPLQMNSTSAAPTGFLEKIMFHSAADVDKFLIVHDHEDIKFISDAERARTKALAAALELQMFVQNGDDPPFLRMNVAPFCTPFGVNDVLSDFLFIWERIMEGPAVDANKDEERAVAEMKPLLSWFLERWKEVMVIDVSKELHDVSKKLHDEVAKASGGEDAGGVSADAPLKVKPAVGRLGHHHEILKDLSSSGANPELLSEFGLQDGPGEIEIWASLETAAAARVETAEGGGGEVEGRPSPMDLAAMAAQSPMTAAAPARGPAPVESTSTPVTFDLAVDNYAISQRKLQDNGLLAGGIYGKSLFLSFEIVVFHEGDPVGKS